MPHAAKLAEADAMFASGKTAIAIALYKRSPKGQHGTIGNWPASARPGRWPTAPHAPIWPTLLAPLDPRRAWRSWREKFWPMAITATET